MFRLDNTKGPPPYSFRPGSFLVLETLSTLIHGSVTLNKFTQISSIFYSNETKEPAFDFMICAGRANRDNFAFKYDSESKECDVSYSDNKLPIMLNCISFVDWIYFGTN